MKAPIAFRSQPGQFEFVGNTQLVNAYAEMMGPDAKNVLAVLPSEGLVEFANTDYGPCRGMIHLPDLDTVYSVHPSGVFSINSSGTAALIDIMPGTDHVQLSRNQKTTPQVFIQGTFGVRVLESNTLTVVSDADFPSDVVTAEHIGGYTAAGRENRVWNISGINDSQSWDALDFATFEQQAGELVRIQEDNGELIGMCNSWLEWWRETGNADFPFEPLTFRSRGLLAKNSVSRSDSTLCFIGDDNIVYKLSGYNAVPISTPEISRLIEADASPSSILGFSFDRQGHKFYVLKGTDWTRCYDSLTGVWHSRQSYHLDTWRAQHSVRAFGKTLVGDRESGKIFYLDRDTYTEDSGTFVWTVISPPLHVFPNGAILDAVHFDLATGYGTVSGQGSDPKVMLEVSKDGGVSFDTYRELSLGATGNRQVRVTARRLGRFGEKGVVFKLSISDPVVRALTLCDVELRPLKR